MFKKGDQVRIEADDRAVDGEVLIASPNGRSLMLTFEAIIYGHVGMLPVFQKDDGSYVTLIGDQPVSIAFRHH